MRKAGAKCSLLMVCVTLLLAGCAERGKPSKSPVQSGGQMLAKQHRRTAFCRRLDSDAGQPETDSFWVTDNRNVVELTDYETIGYKSVDAFLEETGFADQTPFYQYFDEDSGALLLDLYYDENDGTGGGVIYYPEWEEGFLFDTENGPDNEMIKRASADPYAPVSADGYDSAQDEDLEQYQEQMEYLEDGRPLHYLAQGRHNVWETDEIGDIVRIEWGYRGDGSLKWRYYECNQSVYGSFLSIVRGEYDTQGRVVYEWGYIMHGNVDFYYIYSGDDTVPGYYLRIDHNCGDLLVTFTADN